jgi:hypothetical protein
MDVMVVVIKKGKRKMNLEKLEHYTHGFHDDLEEAMKDPEIPIELKTGILHAQIGVSEMIIFFLKKRLKQTEVKNE